MSLPRSFFSLLPLLLFASLGLSATLAFGQVRAVQSSGGSGFGGYSSGYGYEQGWTYSLFSAQLQKELEIVGDQAEKIKKIRADYYKSQQELYQNHYKQGTRDALAREELRERVDALREKMTEDLKKALLPHQVKRAREIWVQNQFRNGGIYGLRDARIRELLEISDEQYEQMLKRSKELNAEIAKKYQELRAAAAEELMKELTAAQRAKLKELSGEKYEPERIDYRQQYEQRRAEQQKAKEQSKSK